MIRKRSITVAAFDLDGRARLQSGRFGRNRHIGSERQLWLGQIRCPHRQRRFKRIVEIDPDLVISTGDMVAGQRIPNLVRQTGQRDVEGVSQGGVRPAGGCRNSICGHAGKP